MENKEKIVPFTLRLKPNILRLLDKTADTIGLDRTATVTSAIRAYAKSEGITLNEEEMYTNE